MDHDSLVLQEFFVLRHLQTKKRLKNKQNKTVLQLIKLLLLPIRCEKSRRKLNVVVLQPRRRSRTPSMFKPEKEFRAVRKAAKTLGQTRIPPTKITKVARKPTTKPREPAVVAHNEVGSSQVKITTSRGRTTMRTVQSTK
jgi:hypothetical protein